MSGEVGETVVYERLDGRGRMEGGRLSAVWVATAGQPARGGLRDDISPCAHCGAPRAFEFQVMPQLLHYLRVDADAQMPGGRPGEAVRLAAMDWGTLAAYTCTKSCDVPEVGYVEEVLWRQEPMA